MTSLKLILGDNFSKRQKNRHYEFSTSYDMHCLLLSKYIYFNVSLKEQHSFKTATF